MSVWCIQDTYKLFTKLDVLKLLKIKGKVLWFAVKNVHLESKAISSLGGLLAKGYLSTVGMRFLDGTFFLCTEIACHLTGFWVLPDPFGILDPFALLSSFLCNQNSHPFSVAESSWLATFFGTSHLLKPCFHSTVYQEKTVEIGIWKQWSYLLSCAISMWLHSVYMLKDGRS